MYCDLIGFVQAACLRFWEQCRVQVSALVALFQQKIPDLSHTHSLAHRQIKIGGVENTGNSCIFAVLLQEFAALSKVFDSLLFSPLTQSLSEPDDHFIARQALQKNLQECVENIRAGVQVERAKIRVLAEQLQHLGWEGYLSSFWQSLIHRFAPSIFPLPHFDVHELYVKILQSLLEQKPISPIEINLTRKDKSHSWTQLFASSDRLKESYPKLWRVALDASSDSPQKRFQIASWEFSLRAIHAYRMTSSGKHVVVYRNCEEELFCCNDTRITQEGPSSIDTIYMAVYESQKLTKNEI